MNAVFKALGAFNYNAGSYIAYAFANNAWNIIIVIAAVALTVMSVMSAMETTVTEEQNIL